MGLLWNRSGVERLGFGTLGLHKCRVAGRCGVIGEAPSIRRPTDFGNAFEGDTWFAAQRWHDPGADRAIVQRVRCAHPEKKAGAVRRELNRPNPRLSELLRKPAPSDIVECASSDLSDQDADRSIACREERHELTVARDRSRVFGSFEIGEALVACIGEGVTPEVIGLAV